MGFNFCLQLFFKLFLVQIKMITLVRQITKAIYLKLGVPESEGDS